VGGVPNAVGAVADYTSSGTTSLAIAQNIAAGVTLGSFNYTGSTAQSLTVTLTNAITLNQDGAGSGFATISNGNSSTGAGNTLFFSGGSIVLADDLLISNSGGSANLTGAIQVTSLISGSGNLTLSNSSTTLSQTGSIRIQTAANTFTGSVLVQKGTTTFNVAGAFGNAANTITLGQSGQGSAALLTTSGGLGNSITVASGSGGTLTLGRSGTGTSTFSGTVLLNGDVSLYSEVTNATGFVFSNVISGVGGVTKTGTATGILALTNANTFTGDTTVSAGILKIGNNLALQNSALDTSGAGSINITGFITPTFGGLKGSTNLASVITSGYSAVTGITLNPGASVSNTYSGIIADGAAGTTLTKTGPGTQILSGANSYTGSTAIANGTLQLSTASNRLPTGTVVSLGQSADVNLGKLDINGQNQQIAGLVSIAGNNAGLNTNVVTSTSAATLTINCNTSTSYTYSAGTAANSGIISGAISLSKTGSGTQILGGDNTYTGTTTVGMGTLVINGAQSGAGLVTVQLGGTLGGDGSLAGSLHFDSGANFLFSPTATLSVNGGANVVDFANFGISNLVGLTSSVDAGVYTLIDGTAAFDFTNVANFGAENSYDLGGGKSAYFQAGSLQLVVIPEPGVFSLIGAFGVIGLIRRRR
jgi:autotransporter-associated beta strand protein